MRVKRASVVGIFAPHQFAHHHHHDLDTERGRSLSTAHRGDGGHAHHRHHDLGFLGEEEAEGGALGGDAERPRPAVGRRRQVVGILVSVLAYPIAWR